MKTPFLWFLAALLLGATGCLETTSFPDEPVIEFRDFVQYPDSAVLTIGFTDGDGNFGLDQADTTGNFCTSGCFFYWNYFAEYYEKENGEWVHQAIDWTDPDELPFYYRVPRVIPTGQNPSLEGEIEVVLKPFYYLISSNDTARFEIHIADRDLNESNTVVTPEFVKP